MTSIPSDHLKCVAFLTVGEPADDGVIRQVPRGTAFFVGVPVEDTNGIRVDYIVTARHCLEQVGMNTELRFRFNTLNQGFVEIPTKTDDWFRSDTDDVAVFFAKPGGLPEGLTSKEIDGVSLSLSSFAGEDYRWRGTAEGIGEADILPSVGNEVYVTGLFTEHPGAERNLPIARFGHISRMPSDIHLKSGDVHYSVKAYLMEFQSMGGLSGSPVFFLYPITIAGTDIEGQPTFDNGHLSGLIGIVNAHFEIGHSPDALADWDSIVSASNSGIAVVTPADAIRRLLMRDDVVQERKDVILGLLEESGQS